MLAQMQALKAEVELHGMAIDLRILISLWDITMVTYQLWDMTMVTMGYYYGISNYMGYNYGNYNHRLYWLTIQLSRYPYVMACNGM